MDRWIKGLAIALVATAGFAHNTKLLSHVPDDLANSRTVILASSFSICDPTTIDTQVASIRLMATRYKGKAIAFNVRAPAARGISQLLTVVLEFPNTADAERFHFSSEYAEVRRLHAPSTGGPGVVPRGSDPRPH